MKLTGAAMVFLLFFQQQNCDLTGPEAKRQIEDAFHSYFPLAKANLDPDRGWIQSFTCARGVGIPIIEQTARQFIQDGKYNEMRQKMSLGGAASMLGGLITGKRGVSYRYFDVGFEQGFYRFDLTNNTNQWLPAGPDYQNQYQQNCGTSSTPQAIPSHLSVAPQETRDEKIWSVIQKCGDDNETCLANRVPDLCGPPGPAWAQTRTEIRNCLGRPLCMKDVFVQCNSGN